MSEPSSSPIYGGQWIHLRHYGVQPNFNGIGEVLLVDEPLDASICSEAANWVVASHESLRTRFFIDGNGQWRQTFLQNAASDPFEYLDLSTCPDPLLQNAIANTAEHILSNFDIYRADLIRFVLIDLGSQRPNRVLFLAHHLVCDGHSTKVVWRDFVKAYRSLESGQRPELARKSTVRDYVERLQARVADEKFHTRLRPWLNSLRSEPSILPFKRPNTQGCQVSAECKTLGVFIDTSDLRNLRRQLLRHHRVWLQDGILAALLMALARQYGQGYLPIWYILSGQTLEELCLDQQDLVGFLTFSTSLDFDVDPERSFKDVLADVSAAREERLDKATDFGAAAFLDCGVDKASTLRPTWEMPILFNYWGDIDAWDIPLPVCSAPEQVQRFKHPDNIYYYDLVFQSDIRDGRLAISADFIKSLQMDGRVHKLVDEAQIQIILEDMKATLLTLATDDFTRPQEAC